MSKGLSWSNKEHHSRAILQRMARQLRRPGKPPGVECGNQEQALPAETRKGMLWLWVLPGTIGGAMIRRLTENRPRLSVAFHLAVVLVPVATPRALHATLF